MEILKILKRSFVAVILVSLFVWLFIFNWSFVFKKKIVGELVAVERVAGTIVVTNSPSDALNPQVFSFSVAIKDMKTNEIHMASSEDRKWAAAQKGNCVVAAFFPYAPWNFKKGMTDHNARLIKNYDNCQLIDLENESIWEKISFFFLWM